MPVTRRRRSPIRALSSASPAKSLLIATYCQRHIYISRIYFWAPCLPLSGHSFDTFFHIQSAKNAAKRHLHWRPGSQKNLTPFSIDSDWFKKSNLLTLFPDQELLKHTQPDHPDYPLLQDAQSQAHLLALKINQTEAEAVDLMAQLFPFGKTRKPRKPQCTDNHFFHPFILYISEQKVATKS